MDPQALVTSVVSGAVAGIGVVGFAVKRHFSKVDKVDDHEERLIKLESAVASHADFVGQVDKLAVTVEKLAGLIAGIGEGVAYLRGRFEEAGTGAARKRR